MDMPRPGDAHKKLSSFVGDWIGTETLHPSPWDPAGGTAAARVVNRWVVDGFAVVQDYEQRRGGAVNFRGHGVIWFDAARQQYVMHWVDSMSGNNSEHRGAFTGDVLTLGAPMPMGGHSRTVWDFSKPGAYTFLIEVSPDGQNWAPAMSGAYTKRAKAKAAAKKKTRPKQRAVRPAKRTKKTKKSKKR